MHSNVPILQQLQSHYDLKINVKQDQDLNLFNKTAKDDLSQINSVSRVFTLVSAPPPDFSNES